MLCHKAGNAQGRVRPDKGADTPQSPGAIPSQSQNSSGDSHSSPSHSGSPHRELEVNLSLRMSCRLQQCSSSSERKAGGGKGTLQTLNTHLTHLHLAALSFSSAFKKNQTTKPASLTGCKKNYFYTGCISKSSVKPEMWARGAPGHPPAGKTPGKIPTGKGKDQQQDAPEPGLDGKIPQVPRALGSHHLSWDDKQEHRFAERKLRKGDTKLLDIWKWDQGGFGREAKRQNETMAFNCCAGCASARLVDTHCSISIQTCLSLFWRSALTWNPASKKQSPGSTLGSAFQNKPSVNMKVLMLT